MHSHQSQYTLQWWTNFFFSAAIFCQCTCFDCLWAVLCMISPLSSDYYLFTIWTGCSPEVTLLLYVVLPVTKCSLPHTTFIVVLTQKGQPWYYLLDPKIRHVINFCSIVITILQFSLICFTIFHCTLLVTTKCKIQHWLHNHAFRVQLFSNVNMCTRNTVYILNLQTCICTPGPLQNWKDMLPMYGQDSSLYTPKIWGVQLHKHHAAIQTSLFSLYNIYGTGYGHLVIIKDST
jgi:hypothetical protein